jgi:putative ABC transport system substrate-binding protein
VKRREFITLLVGAAAAWPVGVRGQQAMAVVGFINAATSEGYARMVVAFRQALKEAGYVEGQSVTIEYRWAGGQIERLPTLAADLVRRRADVIVAGGFAAARAAKEATATIPIVFTIGLDPVESGLVASLNKPGGNLTGITSLAVELGPKLLELVHEAVPAAKIAGLLVNPNNPNAETLWRDLQAAAQALRLEPHIVHATSEGDFDAAFAALMRIRAGVLVIGTDPLFSSRSEQLAELTSRHAIPSIYRLREFAAAGGLMSYGAGLANSYHLAGVHVARILKGEKPEDLPVQQTTKVELVINLKTAKALGLTIPLPLLGRADEVIE